MQEFKQPQTVSNEVNQKFDMYFHSALRNVGLYTSLSFAALAYSRVHRGKTPIYDMILIAISMAFLLLSFTMNYVLNSDIKQHLEQSEQSEKERMYLLVSQSVFGIHGVLFVLGLGTLVRLYIMR
jgi:hypothetical protein